MNNSNRNDDSWILLAIGSFLALIAFVIWKFSELFGLDINTGASVLLRMFFLAFIIFAIWKFGDDIEIIHLRNTWPILLALFWSCWWPAMDFWAAKKFSPFFRSDEIYVLWWNAWYTKWGVFAILVGLAYLIMKSRDNY